MKPKPFIPAWLNQAGLSQADFRTYCCLAARADIKTGIAWPKAETIASDCSMARRTVWKSLRSLEEKKFIRKNGKRFADSNRYQVLVPIGANEAPIGEAPTVANEAPIETPPIGANEAPPIGAPFASSIGANGAPGKTTKKSNQRRVTTNENSPEAIQFAVWFKSSLPQEQQDGLPKNWLKNYCQAYDEMIRLDKKTPEQIREVCRWARTDQFWKQQIRTPGKLRERDKQGTKYFDVITERMKQPTNGHHQKPASDTERSKLRDETTIES